MYREIPVAIISVLVLSLGTLGGTLADSETGQAAGQEIFEEYCAVCHGYDGSPVIPEAPSFKDGERLEKNDVELLKSITKGLGEIMPPWEGEISDNDCKKVLSYIRDSIAKIN